MKSDKQVRRSDRPSKRHVISLRISSVEWDSLHDAMNDLKFKRVSDLMREALKLVQAPHDSFGGLATSGQGSIGLHEHPQP